MTMKTKVTQGQSRRLKETLVFCVILEQTYQPNLDCVSEESMFHEKNKSVFLNRAADKLHRKLDSILVEIFKIHMAKTTDILNSQKLYTNKSYRKYSSLMTFEKSSHLICNPVHFQYSFVE